MFACKECHQDVATGDDNWRKLIDGDECPAPDGPSCNTLSRQVPAETTKIEPHFHGTERMRRVSAGPGGVARYRKISFGVALEIRQVAVSPEEVQCQLRDRLSAVVEQGAIEPYWLATIGFLIGELDS